MKLSDFDYELPESAIAQEPLPDRAASKLLWLHRTSGAMEDRTFRDVVDILRPNDLLVLNDTRVTARRLFGEKNSGAKVELLLLREIAPGEFETLARPGRRLQAGAEILFEGLKATVIASLASGRKHVRFIGDLAQLNRIGRVPLPPYIHAELKESERYQTVYGSTGGSAAAPTAGLHFTQEILDQLRANGIGVSKVTLDVGLDTFRPITSDDPLDHAIHGERCSLPEATRAAVEQCRGRIVAVGTTAVRTLESFAIGPRQVRSGEMETRLFITPEGVMDRGFPTPRAQPSPGEAFWVVDGMFTNFHMPRTTMLLMISALAGRAAIMSAYQHALERGYRFLSFGDSMLIL